MQASFKILFMLIAAVCYVVADPYNDFNNPIGRPNPIHPIYPIPTTPPFNPRPRYPPMYRFRRSPQGSVDVSVMKPEHDKPSLQLDYNQRIFGNDRSKLEAFGGVSSPDMRHFYPQGGAKYEWNPNPHTFLRAHGGVQQGPGGHFDPNVGATFGMRFRRDAEEEGEEEFTSEY